MPTDSSQNGWNEYSRLVLAELKRLDTTCLNLNASVIKLNEEIVHLQGVEDEVEALSEDVKSLNSFKAYGIALWAGIQLCFGAILAWILKS